MRGGGGHKQATMLAIVASVTLQVPDKLGALFSDDVQARTPALARPRTFAACI